MALLRQYPLVEVGKGEFAEGVGHVAHNSYVHCYTELGLLGGTFFFAAFYISLAYLRRLGAARRGDLTR